MRKHAIYNHKKYGELSLSFDSNGVFLEIYSEDADRIKEDGEEYPNDWAELNLPSMLWEDYEIKWEE